MKHIEIEVVGLWAQIKQKDFKKRISLRAVKIKGS